MRIETYNYTLPDQRIAKYPLPRRDESKLLTYRDGKIGETIFKHIATCLPPDSLLVFNNTRVIQARLPFRKETGARVEVFCLEPAEPADYALAFQQTEHCRWTCLVGKLKKWKNGATLSKDVDINGERLTLHAERETASGDTHLVTFSWDNPSFTFADVIEHAGVLPIPPYLHRETEESDLDAYQTVYSRIKGSVAAPTAGLHFTPEVLQSLDAAGFGREELTLHVGAGTFKPIQRDRLEEHEMHTEFIAVDRSTIERIKKHPGKVIAVGTTSVRTLESLYYVGVILSSRPEATSGELCVTQWMPYLKDNNRLPVKKSLQNVLDYLDRHHIEKLITSTQIMIVPGYEFKIVEGIVTNFHQPKSTLLLLVSAFVKGDWKRIYTYALKHDFRFLSYGDSSLLL